MRRHVNHAPYNSCRSGLTSQRSARRRSSNRQLPICALPYTLCDEVKALQMHTERVHGQEDENLTDH